MTERTFKPILCLDFDGVIHSYTSPWKDAYTIEDPPVPGAFEWINRASEFFQIHVYSSRSKTEEGRNAMFEWFLEHGGPATLVTFSHEKPSAFLTIDDRALCFQGSFADIDPEKLLGFKPWNKRK